MTKALFSCQAILSQTFLFEAGEDCSGENRSHGLVG